MANVVQLKHLEHLEDEMLNYGVAGCKAAVSFLKELNNMMGQSESTGFMQTKWDGAPSIICGTDPANGFFFVGTKSVFNKDKPKICYADDQIDEWYSGDLAEKLKYSLKYFMKLGIKGVIQGDLMFTDTTRREETVDGERLYTFKPNTITYGIPKEHDIGKRVGNAKIGVVFHTHYTGEKDGYDLSSMSAKAGAPVHTFNDVKDVVVIKNDTPMDRVGWSSSEQRTFNAHVSKIERMCMICGDFLDELVTFSGTTGDLKWHVSTYIKQFFNSEIKNARSIGNVDKALDDLTNFYHLKTAKMLDKITTEKTKAQKRKLVYDSEHYLQNNKRKFTAMLALYKEIQQIKQTVIDKLDHLETFRTFIKTEKGYKITGPEGYVMHKDGDMIKFVNRLEFAYNNFTVSKDW